MNILHVYRSLDRKAGGTATAVPALCRELSFLKECDISLLTYSLGEGDQIEDTGNTKIIVKNYKNSILLSLLFKVLPNLDTILTNIDIVHLNGVWPPLNSVVAIYALIKGKKIIVTPHANLMPGDIKKTPFKKIKKMIAWNLYIKFWAKKSCFHVTAENEFKAIKDIWHKGKIVQLPNGINVSEFSTLPTIDIIINKFPELKNKKILLFLSRIYRNKGLSLLAHAWGTLASDFPDWHLLIVGQGDNKHWLEIEAILNNYNMSNRYTYAGHLDGKLRLSAYNAANLFVLPTYWENFGIVIAEALMANTPVITTTKAPWDEIVTKKCGWIIEPDQKELIDKLKIAMSLPSEELKKMGALGAEFVMKNYDWKSIAVKMRKYYEQIISGN